MLGFKTVKSRNVLFISRDDREYADLVRKHLDVEIVEIKCRREDFSDYLNYLEELFGGIATLRFRRFKVRRLPCLILEGKKVFEGPVPLFQIYELLGVSKPPEKYSEVKTAEIPKPVPEQKIQSKCYRCVFFNEKRSRCVIYGVVDPLNPPCK